jgi:hypothetical protein
LGRKRTEEIILLIFSFLLFNRNDYGHNKLPVEIDLHVYVASGIVVINLKTNRIKWIFPFAVSTGKKRRWMVCFHFFFLSFFFSKKTVGNDRSSYITSSPTVVDLEGDGMLEIVASTNLGLFM